MLILNDLRVNCWNQIGSVENLHAIKLEDTFLKLYTRVETGENSPWLLELFRCVMDIYIYMQEGTQQFKQGSKENRIYFHVNLENDNDLPRLRFEGANWTAVSQQE